MKTPQYRSNLQQLLEQEKVRANVAFVTLLIVFVHFAIVVPISSPTFFCSLFSMQQKHRDLSGQAEQLHSVCQAHKDKIKGLFQAKLDEVRSAALLHRYITVNIMCPEKPNLFLICSYMINFNSLNYGLVLE